MLNVMCHMFNTRRRIWKRIALAVFCFSCIVVLTITAYAGTGGEQVITTSVPCAVTINVGQNGSVVAGTVELTGKGNVVSVAYGTPLTLKITPKAGYAISKVLFNEQDVTSSIANSMYTTQLLRYNASIDISFATEAHVHTWGEYQVDKAPTCTEHGSKSVHCKSCDAQKDVKAIAPLGHDWDSGKIIREATASQDGQKMFTCKRCGATKYETYALHSHGKTADEGHIYGWLFVMLASAAMISTSLVLMARSKRNSFH